MSNPSMPRLVVGTLAALLIVAGCGNGPVVSASPTASVAPSVSATGSAAPSASAALAPTPVQTTDAVAAILNKALTDSFSFAFDVADRHIESKMTGREIRQDGALAGLVLVMTIDRLTMTRDVFNAAAHAAADSAGGKVAFKTISGEWVAIVTTKDATFGMYALHDEIVLVGGPIGTDSETLLTAVIKANK